MHKGKTYFDALKFLKGFFKFWTVKRKKKKWKREKISSRKNETGQIFSEFNSFLE